MADSKEVTMENRGDDSNDKLTEIKDKATVECNGKDLSDCPKQETEKPEASTIARHPDTCDNTDEAVTTEFSQEHDGGSLSEHVNSETATQQAITSEKHPDTCDVPAVTTNTESLEAPAIIESAMEDAENLNQYEEVAEKLATGCLSKHLPHIEHAKEQMAQLTESQRVLIETIHQENQKFGECQTLTDVTDIMDKAKFYLDKLTKIKKEMFTLHEKSAKLKRRALKIQQEKIKEELQREHQKEREFERERQLIAQPVQKPDPKTSASTHSESSESRTSKTEGISTAQTEDSSVRASGHPDSVQSSTSNVT